MKDIQLKVIAGALLHDVGKLCHRNGASGTHSQSGCEFLKTAIGITDEAVLNCVRYHHADVLKSAKLQSDDPAYIVYIADNIAAAADRREASSPQAGFDRSKPLASVFNLLNQNHGCMNFAGMLLDGSDSSINYPSERNTVIPQEFYSQAIAKLTTTLRALQWSEPWINSLLTTLESVASFVPSSTSNNEVADISLYDHSKITAAVASCIQQYLDGEHDLRGRLFGHAEDFYKEEAFLLHSLDISGIQKFIYTITSAGALKSLRARSFYLEILMEHVIDEILSRLSLSRANLLYSGGGHCYMLLPNTKQVKDDIKQAECEINSWFIDNFDVALYIASGSVECSALDLENKPNGSFSELYRKVSAAISESKSKRYSPDELKRLNSKPHNGTRECVICHRTGKLDSESRCATCASLVNLSSGIIKNDFFVILDENSRILDSHGHIGLPFGAALACADESFAKKCIQDPSYRRLYSKNAAYTGSFVATHLWVGDYSAKDLNEYASSAGGIERIGVLRADVDNLGSTFAFGFRSRSLDGKVIDKYATLSRTATLSRLLSLFFKKNINSILENGKSQSLSGGGRRNVSIIYSGGDDVFLAGSWNDVIDSFIDIRESFRKFSQGTLSISGGIGIYPAKYPISSMAVETEELVECSKELDGKDGITLFEPGEAFKWDEFSSKVLGEKFSTIKTFFHGQALDESQHQFGLAFLYRLLGLIRGRGGNKREPLNAARLAYLLSRMEPKKDAPAREKEHYSAFADAIYGWYLSSNDSDRNELITATYLYDYIMRGEGCAESNAFNPITEA